MYANDRLDRCGHEEVSACPKRVIIVDNWRRRSQRGVCVSHREPAADVSDEEEGVLFEVAHHGVAATQLCGPAVPLVVVADGAVPNHGQDEGEDPLVVKGGKQRDEETLHSTTLHLSDSFSY